VEILSKKIGLAGGVLAFTFGFSPGASAFDRPPLSIKPPEFTMSAAPETTAPAAASSLPPSSNSNVSPKLGDHPSTSLAGKKRNCDVTGSFAGQKETAEDIEWRNYCNGVTHVAENARGDATKSSENKNPASPSAAGKTLNSAPSLKGSTQASTIKGATEANLTAGAQSRAAADDATAASKFYKSTAQLGSRWHSDFSQRYQAYSSQANKARTQGPNDYANFQQQNFTAPSEVAPLYRQVGVATKGDVLEHAPEYLPNLQQGIEEDKKSSNSWEQAAAQAAAAAGQLAGMASSLQGKAAQMSSLSGSDPSEITKPHDASAGRGSNGSLDSADAVISGASNGASKSSSNPDPTDSAAAQKSAAAKQPDQSEFGLRARLKAAMKEVDFNRFNGKLPGGIASAGNDDLTHDTLGAILQGAAGGAEGSRDAAGAASGAGGSFTMSGSETDAAVRALTNNGEASIGDRRTLASMETSLGAVNETLFVRISRSIRHYESNKRVR
jgi:hypothetical protein